MSFFVPFMISGTGCALVDYLYLPVRFDAEGFRKYLSLKPGDGGLSPGKLVFTEELEKFAGNSYLNIRAEVTEGRDPVAVNIGGPSVVSLIHASQMLQNTNAEVMFYGCRGNDPAGHYISQKLAGTPLKAGYYKEVSAVTPFTDVLSDPGYDNGHGERIFINNIGAAYNFLPADLPPGFFNSTVVVFGGTALVPQVHARLKELLLRAKQCGAITVVNTVYDFLSEKKDPEKPWPLGDSDETYRYIDLLITDREEAIRHSGCITEEEALRFFKEAGTGAAVITRGPHPVIYCSSGGLFRTTGPAQMPVSEKVSMEIRNHPALAGDTTGCGDNFTGGVLASLAMQLMENPSNPVSLEKAIALGIASGGFCCFYHGGAYFEHTAGEKARLVNDYYMHYVKQLNLKGGY